jgi:hypothetical protein
MHPKNILWEEEEEKKKNKKTQVTCDYEPEDSNSASESDEVRSQKKNM